MGTRALSGFIVNSTDYLTYSQYDGYPDGLGTDVLAFLRLHPDLDALKAAVEALVLVDETGEPTPEQLIKLAGRYHQQVSSGKDWYSHLRGTQGNMALVLESGFMANHGGAGARQPDDIWLEYSYVIDLDKGEFRYYPGNLAVPAKGTWPLAALPSNDEFLAWAATA